MEARKKKVPAKKPKRKSSSRSALEVKQIIEEKIKLYQKQEAKPSIVQEEAAIYGKRKPKQGNSRSAATNKEIVKKLKALKQLTGIFAGQWPLEDAQEYVNRLRNNDRY